MAMASAATWNSDRQVWWSEPEPVGGAVKSDSRLQTFLIFGHFWKSEIDHEVFWAIFQICANLNPKRTGNLLYTFIWVETLLWNDLKARSAPCGQVFNYSFFTILFWIFLYSHGSCTHVVACSMGFAVKNTHHKRRIIINLKKRSFSSMAFRNVPRQLLAAWGL